jgi:hypothetical protein
VVETLEEVYKFVDRAMEEAVKHGRLDIAKKLEDALHLGSSSLEILGAIKVVLSQEATTIDSWLNKSEREEAINFVSQAFGSR